MMNQLKRILLCVFFFLATISFAYGNPSEEYTCSDSPSASIGRRLISWGSLTVTSFVLLPTALALMICIVVGKNSFGFEFYKFVFKIGKFASRVTFRNIIRIFFDIENLEYSAEACNDGSESENENDPRKMFYVGNI